MDMCLTVLTDGRKQYIEKTIPSWMEHYDSLISNKFIIDDSGQGDYRAWLKEYFPSFTIIPVGESRCGYSNAMNKVFSTIVESKTKYVLHLEDDFILNKPVSLENIVDVLDKNPLVSQMSIMRQPWFANEREHGGVIEALEKQGSTGFKNMNTDGHDWVRHSSFWTCNPSVFPLWVAEMGWPEAPWSEMKFSQEIHSKNKFSGIWGSRTSWPHTEHIGEERNGTEY